jgi:hypothetical protein
MPWVGGGGWEPASFRGKVLMYGSFLVVFLSLGIWHLFGDGPG